MGKNLIENLSKILELDSCKASICAIKGITVINDNNFVLEKRGLIRDYRKTTGDYRTGWFKSLFTGKLELTGKQIENYQYEYSKDIRNYNFRNVFREDVD
ncbi:MAG: hypothetical protein BWY36_00237 [Candidatus Diapherotrites archaeon ADurb.Bin253]|jgi:hypothetical protein|nr:MAG: hypothetical protein BWY36_00237 [Candidatus Diapherotrites archaeon ADurb.Bin253]HNZ52180.1 hypothetical protein [Candidatus Pacearchaeota archaeon]HOC96735.1 hypothetical protein [Candidatus Pacearchaeota archaeon]HOH04293.1 hypothetical protein [Candidatus Pacearchaeota archaeon]HPX74521.1 hypothetical protein [Candidatus Pacearchaeota archaeon]